MQILQPTWPEIVSRYDVPPGGASSPSRYHPHDAISAAAFYLCGSGAPTNLRAGIWAYNHVDWYVGQVRAQAATYPHQCRHLRVRRRPSQWLADGEAPLPPTGTGGQLTPRMHTLNHALATAGAIRGGATLGAGSAWTSAT